MRNLSATAAVLALTVVPNAAQAAVTIEKSSSFVQPEENVQLDTDTTPGDNQLQGTTNQTDSKVVFTSSTDNLVAPPQGQARIEPLDGSLDQLTLSLLNNQTFTSAEFNILSDTGGSVSLFAYDSSNTVISSLTSMLSANGQNFFGFSADPSTPISSIGILAGTGTSISSIGQFRLGGVAVAMSPVPEIGTWAMLIFGFAGLGLAMRTRKQKIRSARVRIVF